MSIVRAMAHRRPFLALAIVLILAAGALAVRASAQGQPMPKSVTIGTNPPGTVFFAVASGVAKVVGEAAGFRMVVQPHAGSSTFLPLIDRGELEFGVKTPSIWGDLSRASPTRSAVAIHSPTRPTSGW